MGNYFKGPINPGQPVLFPLTATTPNGGRSGSGDGSSGKKDKDGNVGMAGQTLMVREQEYMLNSLKEDINNTIMTRLSKGEEMSTIGADKDFQKKMIAYQNLNFQYKQNNDMLKPYAEQATKFENQTREQGNSNSRFVDDKGNSIFINSKGEQKMSYELTDEDLKDYRTGNARYLTVNDYYMNTWENFTSRNADGLIDAPSFPDQINRKERYFTTELDKYLQEASSKEIIGNKLSRSGNLVPVNFEQLRQQYWEGSTNISNLMDASKNIKSYLSSQAIRDAKQEFWEGNHDKWVYLNGQADRLSEVTKITQQQYDEYKAEPLMSDVEFDALRTKVEKEIKLKNPNKVLINSFYKEDLKRRVQKDDIMNEEEVFDLYLVEKALTLSKSKQSDSRRTGYLFTNKPKLGGDGEGSDMSKLKYTSLLNNPALYNEGKGFMNIFNPMMGDGKDGTKRIVEQVPVNFMWRTMAPTTAQAFTQQWANQSLGTLTQNVITATGDVINYNRGNGNANVQQAQNYFSKSIIVGFDQELRLLPEPQEDGNGNFIGAPNQTSQKLVVDPVTKKLVPVMDHANSKMFYKVKVRTPANELSDYDGLFRSGQTYQPKESKAPNYNPKNVYYKIGDDNSNEFLGLFDLNEVNRDALDERSEILGTGVRFEDAKGDEWVEHYVYVPANTDELFYDNLKSSNTGTTYNANMYLNQEFNESLAKLKFNQAVLNSQNKK